MFCNARYDISAEKPIKIKIKISVTQAGDIAAREIDICSMLKPVLQVQFSVHLRCPKGIFVYNSLTRRA